DVGGEVTVAGGLLQEEDADKIEAGDARRPLKEGVALVKLMLVLCAGRLRQLAGLVADFERESGAAPRGAQFGQVLIVPTIMGRVVLQVDGGAQLISQLPTRVDVLLIVAILVVVVVRQDLTHVRTETSPVQLDVDALTQSSIELGHPNVRLFSLSASGGLENHFTPGDKQLGGATKCRLALHAFG